MVQANVNRNANDRGDDAPMLRKVDIPETERRIGISGEIDGIESMWNKAQEEENVSPECESCNVQGQHQKDSPTNKNTAFRR